jgi:hypothetical protein
VDARERHQIADELVVANADAAAASLLAGRAGLAVAVAVAVSIAVAVAVSLATVAISITVSIARLGVAISVTISVAVAVSVSGVGVALSGVIVGHARTRLAVVGQDTLADHTLVIGRANVLTQLTAGIRAATGEGPGEQPYRHVLVAPHCRVVITPHSKCEHWGAEDLASFGKSQLPSDEIRSLAEVELDFDQRRERERIGAHELPSG